MLFAAMLMDVLYLGYSSWGDRYIGKLDMKILVFLTVVGLNVAASVPAQMLHNKVFGFSFWRELTVCLLIHLSFNVANIWWNFKTDLELHRFFQLEMKVDLSKHMWWSFFLSNVGLPVVIYYRLLLYSAIHTFHPEFAIIPESIGGWSVIAIIVCAMPFACCQFYFVHRMIHSSPALYKFVHKVHHVCRYPIPSDGGTESPVELIGTGVPWGYSVLPLPIVALLLVGHFIGTRRDHDGPQEGSPHVFHHSVNTGNYGLANKFDCDSAFGTKIDVSPRHTLILQSWKKTLRKDS